VLPSNDDWLVQAGSMNAKQLTSARPRGNIEENDAFAKKKLLISGC
jgi:hypothetical protein